MTQWKEIRLGDHLSFITSGSRGWSEYYASAGALFLRIQNVGYNELRLEDIAFVQPPEGAEARRTRVQPGDVLLSITADLGRTAVVPEGLGTAHINQHLAILRVKDIDPHYLAAFLSLGPGRLQLKRLDRVGVKSGLNFDDVRSLCILLPSLTEQRRIVAILDKADAIRRKRAEALRLADDFLKSAFLDMFGALSDSLITISDLISSNAILMHKDGNHGSNYPRSEDFCNAGIPFLSAKNINERGILSFDDLSLLNEDKAQILSIGWIQKGDVLLAHNATVGPVALYQGDFKKALIGTSLTAFRPNSEKLMSEFLVCALRSQLFQSQLQKCMAQTTRNQVPITAQRRLSIPIAPISQQRKFALLFRRFIEHTRIQNVHQKESINLFNSLIQRAFRGDL